MKLSLIEKRGRRSGHTRIAGVDEAGRGPLAGPVVAAACVLPFRFSLSGIDDSKKLSPLRRRELYRAITSAPLVDWGVGIVEASEIDELNIHRASLEAMERAILRLKTPPDLVLVDGKFPLKISLPCEAVIGGDGLVRAIAAASIIAKVVRDTIMLGYHTLYPSYEFERHMGYGTEIHREAVDKLGPSPIHRMSFKGVIHE